MNRTARTHRAAAAIAAIALIAAAAAAQSSGDKTDLDAYYRFPLSVGAGYRTLQPLSGFASTFVVREIASELIAPLPFFPVLRPYAKAGSLSYLEAGSAGGGLWDHTEWFAAGGLSYASRFSKNFELGLQAGGGYSMTYFDNLDASGTVGSPGWFAEAGARIALVPSYSFAVEIAPSLRYARSLGPLTEFDGWSFGVGFSGSFRFGQDPDAPASAVNAFRLSGGKLPPVFAAMQSYYASNPIGKLSLANEERVELRNVEISFFQSGYMDAPTPVAVFETVKGRETIEFGLLAAFNQEVFRIEGTVPVAGELIVKYRAKGRSSEQRFPLSYELMDKTAIVWDDDRKVGAFVTPSDSALRNFGSYVRQTLKEEALPQLNEAMQSAAQLYAALGKLGLIYQADPASPFVKAQAGKALVDSVSLGRDTISRGAGDCDDLTVLFASLLESIGIETGYVTVPGHIYPAFNTKLPARSYRELHPDRGMTMIVDETLWIPIEITMVGKQGFADAWNRGIELWKLYDADEGKRAFTRTSAAQAVYRPVALRESDLGLQYGSKEALRESYRAEIGRVADSALESIAAAARKSGDKKDFNALGVLSALYGRTKDAESAFQRAVKLDPGYAAAQVNLGNVAYLIGDYRKALTAYRAAAGTYGEQGKGDSLSAQKVLINMSKAYTALANFTEAKNAFEKAAKIDPERVREFAYLAKVGAGQDNASRASESKDEVLFLEE